MINITKPFLPPKEEYDALLKEIWDRVWLTNHGPLVKSLEQQLASTLGLDRFLFMTNGTVAIQIAIKALECTGEIITTPFSYVATTSCVVWENCKPVFVDISPDTLTIDPKQIEAAITPTTSAILATHVYGIPCDVEAIRAIADKHQLKVIYDAAHCFGVRYKGRSILEYGDVSTISFHATKPFHTVEGGGVYSPHPELMQKMHYMQKFGHDGPDKFAEVGINGKNSEFHAAMGLCNLKYVPQILQRRRELAEHYQEKLKGMSLEYPKIPDETEFNYAYMPVIFESESIMLENRAKLEKHEIFTRRYFYPSLATLPYVEDTELPVTEDISARILCLPLYYDLDFESVDRICEILRS